MALDLIRASYNPDVLSCLANLSSDEVFTPPEIVNQMLDMLPQELFSNPDTTFLDPATKSGVFLREIAKRLMKGLEKQIPDVQQRVDHIFKNQLYGIAITELTSLLARRSLYCSKYPNSSYSVTKFDTPEGNIRFRRIKHTWSDERCIFCGASKEEYDRDESLENHAYELIHNQYPERILNMKFDVIISNPPYQLSTGGNRAQATPLYDKFVTAAKRLNPRYLCMIIPSRWFTGGMGLSSFRDEMLHDKHITHIVDYPNSKDCFDGVDIAGGVNYFLWDRDHTGLCEITSILGDTKNTTERALDEFEGFFIRSNASISIIHKVQEKTKHFLTERVHSLDPFGFPTTVKGEERPFSGCISLIHSKGKGFVKRSDVTKNANLIDLYKVYIARVVPSNGEVGIDPSKGYNAMTQPRLLAPGEVCNFTYMILNEFTTLKEARNFQQYMSLKFPRYMLRLTLASMNISKANFAFVPLLDYTKVWSDDELYQIYDLTDEEIQIVESTMRTMPFSDGGDD